MVTKEEAVSSLPTQKRQHVESSFRQHWAFNSRSGEQHLNSHVQFRSIDGSENNFQDPTLNQAGTGLRVLVRPTGTN
jgi:hypothetical protein